LYKKYLAMHLYNKDLIPVNGLQDMTGLVFTGQAVEMYSNVVNGLGIFAGYSEEKYILKQLDEKIYTRPIK
jgi:hypothetical protein